MTRQTVPAEAGEQFMRPFLRLAKYLSDDFLPLAEHWLFLVSVCGVANLSAKPASKEEWLDFFAHCHDGWKQAQAEVANFLVQALARLAEAKRAEKEQHRLKDKQRQHDAKVQRRQVELEIKVARRMLDVALWILLEGDHSTLRRLYVAGGEHSLSVKNIEEAMRAANRFNSDPQVIALATDMLSFVHVGDLLIANREKGEVDFVELKSGEKNGQLAALADLAVRSGCEQFEQFVTADFDTADKKHFERVKRQAERNETILSTIRNEGGIDPNTGRQIIIQASSEPISNWSGRIEACYKALTLDRTWAIDVIDECVYLGVYSAQTSAVVGFNSWMKGRQCGSKIFNLMDSFYDPRLRPLGAMYLSWDLQKKILRGDVLVIMCLNVSKFIELGNSIQPGFLRLSTRAEAAKAQRYGVELLTENGLHVCATIDGEMEMLGAGVRDRILFDQQSPRQLLANHLTIGQGSRRLESRRSI